MKSLYILLYCIIAVLIVTPVFSARVVVSRPDTENLKILYPESIYQKNNNNFAIHIHIFNSTGHAITGTNATCVIHIYNSTNNHIIKSNMTVEDSDYEYTVLAASVSQDGTYPYLLWCNASNGEAEGIAGKFIITSTGKEEYTINYISIVIALFAIAFLFIYGADKIEFFYLNDVPIAKYLMYLIGAWFTVPIGFTAIRVNEIAGYGLDGTLAGVFSALMTILVLITTFSVLGFLFFVFKRIQESAK